MVSKSTLSIKQKLSKISKNSLKLRWNTIAKIVKCARIPLLLLSAYGIGYQLGIVDYSRDPKLKQEEMLKTLLSEMNTTLNDVLIARDEEFYRFESVIRNPRLHQISKVGHRIIHSAHRYIDTNLKLLQETALEHSEGDDNNNEDKLLTRLYNENKFAREMIDAKIRLDGKWQYILVQSDIANAFVHEVLPNRIFVTTAMMGKFSYVRFNFSEF